MYNKGMLILKNVTLTNRVKDINLTVDESGLCIIGESGAGKSTLLHILAGLLDYQGMLILDDKKISEIPVYQRGISLIFQDPALFPHLKVKRNILYGLDKLGVSKQHQQTLLTSLANDFQIRHLLERYPITLSGGEAQRVNIVRALIRKPRVLLLDEPFSALDMKLAKSLSDAITDFTHHHHIIPIWVLHDQEEAMQFKGKIAYMHKGELIECNTAEMLYYAPHHMQTAKFFGKPEMNILPVKIVNHTLHLFKHDYQVDVEDGIYALGFRKNWVSVHEGNLAIQKCQKHIGAYIYTVEGYEIYCTKEYTSVDVTLSNFCLYKDGNLSYVYPNPKTNQKEMV